MRQWAKAAWAVACAALAIGAGAPATRPAGGEFVRATANVVVDGELSEACWTDAPSVRVDYLYGAKGELADRPRMVARYAWDEHYLYVGYETFDRNVTADGNGKDDGPAGNRRPGLSIRRDDGTRPDVVEFFVSFGDEEAFWEIHHNALNQFNDAWNVSPAGTERVTVRDEKWIGDDGTYTLKTAVKLKAKKGGGASTVNDASDGDAGYVGEMRIPWKGLGVPEGWKRAGGWDVKGKEILILAVCQDSDEKRFYTHSSATFNLKRFARGAKDFPRYVPVDGPATRPTE